MGPWAERERETGGDVSYCLVLFRVSLCPVVPETRVMSCWSLVSCEATRNATRNATDYEQMTEDSATWKRQRLAPSCVAASSKIGLWPFCLRNILSFCPMPIANIAVGRLGPNCFKKTWSLELVWCMMLPCFSVFFCLSKQECWIEPTPPIRPLALQKQNAVRCNSWYPDFISINCQFASSTLVRGWTQ